MVSFNLRGLVPPVFTPFNADFSLNLSVIPQYVKYLKSKGVQGILVNGTTGEGVSMSSDERMKVSEEWIKYCKIEKIHVMIQVGGGSLPDVLKLAQHAEKCGADSILTLPELFFKPSTATELVDHLERISNAAPSTPLLYYHFPGMTNVNLNMASMVAEAQKRVKTFRGLKLTTPNLEDAAAVMRVRSDQTTIFLGCDTLLVAAFALGLDSSIGTTFNMMFEDASSILKSVQNSDKALLRGAAQKQLELNGIFDIITKYGSWVSTMKVAMTILSGIDVGPVRPPNYNLTAQQIQQMSQELQKIKK